MRLDDAPGPNLFHVPLGMDYPAAVVAGLRARLSDAPPEAMARVTLLVNTRRMERRLTALFQEGPAGFAPRIRLLTDLADDPTLPNIPEAEPPLRRRLELERLVAALLAAQPDIAPAAASFDLADSLADLLDEMQAEAVNFDALDRLDLADLSDHWARSLDFLRLIAPFAHPDVDRLDPNARLRRAVDALGELWQHRPPRDPLVIVGSTGSRGPARMLMQLVARQPQGAVILPGFDTDLPDAVWDRLDRIDTAEDHPQYRFHVLMRALDLGPGELRLRPWQSGLTGQAGRGALVSLALRPAPVTDQWLAEGPDLPDPIAATQGLTLIEAPDTRTEAAAIALVMRRAIEDGHSVALITPDRILTRRVSAMLDRWRILPDDSAGRPLDQSPPGRLLRQVADLLATPAAAEQVIALLKHPLCHSGADRGPHQLATRELDLDLRRGQGGGRLADRLARLAQADATADWANWALDFLERARTHPVRASVSDHVRLHLDLVTGLARGAVAPTGTGQLWAEAAGAEALAAMDDLSAAAPAGGDMTTTTYARMIRSVLAARQVRSAEQARGDVVFWGTQEARVQGVDRIILGGLNDGVWPRLPPPDPWLNRQMRAHVGLLSPDRQIGLQAHDFEQALHRPVVTLSRALRDDQAQTVPSRWLNRLVNLMDGLGPTGQAALDEMRQRGRTYLDIAGRIDQPELRTPPSSRPAPRPDPAQRPTRLSVTSIQTLIRDPYAIYARHVLRLRELEPLRDLPDPALRGTVLHRIVEQFVQQTMTGLPDPDEALDLLSRLTDHTLEARVPWPATRRMWRGRLMRIAAAFVADEANRRSVAIPVALEVKGTARLPCGFELTAEADRIDRASDGSLLIYDYKTGSLPTAKQVALADKQLPLEGAMAQAGGFGPSVPAGKVGTLAHIGLGTDFKVQPLKDPDRLIADSWAGLSTLIAAYAQRDQGYLSLRLANDRLKTGAYAHLARFGEWDLSDTAQPEDVP